MNKEANVDEMSLEHGRAKLGTPSDSVVSVDSTSQQVVGSSKLYTSDRQLKYVPMPTPDPKDPLNLATWRKWMALISLAFCKSSTGVLQWCSD
ncbi:MAG: hypothetical protein INR71_07315 [Terriglobus roseus]|nr:hypothetical protein [Terriglobus roseus]